MKSWFDKKARERNFVAGDKVVVLMPVSGGSLHAQYCGPYVIQKKLSDRDYVLHTPDRRQKSRVCHVNMLKAYYDRKTNTEGSLQVPIECNVVSPVALIGLPDACEDVEAGPSRCIIEGRLKNSRMLSTLSEHLPHLLPSEKADILALVSRFLTLFNDVRY